jgi:hypothetical protein
MPRPDTRYDESGLFHFAVKIVKLLPKDFTHDSYIQFLWFNVNF